MVVYACLVSESGSVRVQERAGAAMEAARARTPRGAHKVAIGGGELGAGRNDGDGSYKAWRWCGWRAPVRAEVVVVGCLALATLTLLVLVLGVGGRGGGSLSAFSPPKSTEFVQKPGNHANPMSMFVLHEVRDTHACVGTRTNDITVKDH